MIEVPAWLVAIHLGGLAIEAAILGWCVYSILRIKSGWRRTWRPTSDWL